MKRRKGRRQPQLQVVSKIERLRLAFTVAELLIVIVIIGILTAITSISYRGIDIRAQNARRLNDMSKVKQKLDLYAIDNGSFPATTDKSVPANWRAVDVRTDDNCFNGTSQPDWVPGIDKLPQSTPNTNSTGVDGYTGCYIYASNGTQYVLSAWNMVSTPTTAKPYYRRLGFRSFQTPTSAQFFTCNENVVGGANGGYDINKDYYKHSYTISNITDCNETPPNGA